MRDMGVNAGARHPEHDLSLLPQPTGEEVKQIRTIALDRVIREFPTSFSTQERIACHPWRFRAELDVWRRVRSGGPCTYRCRGLGAAAHILVLAPLFKAVSEKITAFLSAGRTCSGNA